MLRRENFSLILASTRKHLVTFSFSFQLVSFLLETLSESLFQQIFLLLAVTILFTAVLFCHLDARRSGCPPWRGSAGHCKVASFKKKRELFARDSVTRKLHVLSNEVWLLGQNNGSRPCLTFSDTPSMIYRYDFFFKCHPHF